MLQKVWAGENRRMMVCVDAYEGGVMKGRFYNAFQEMEHFESLVQFLIGIETIFRNSRFPSPIQRFADSRIYFRKTI